MAAGMPRNFKLLDELEDAERSQEGGADISLGLASMEDRMMHNWQASIVQAAGNSQDVRVWFLTLNVGSEYPKEPPTIKFTSQVNMDCVDSKGNVVPGKLSYLAEWTPECSMKGALQAVQAALRSAPKSQPADDATY